MLPVMGPFGCRGGCQLRLTQCGFPSTEKIIKSRGADEGATNNAFLS